MIAVCPGEMGGAGLTTAMNRRPSNSGPQLSEIESCVASATRPIGSDIVVASTLSLQASARGRSSSAVLRPSATCASNSVPLASPGPVLIELRRETGPSLAL